MQSSDWFVRARYGLMVHYGLYSLLERGEWVMNREQIPLDEYRQLRARFTADKFDAEAICDLAVRAGTPFDTATTFIVLLGYAIPSFVMGVVLLVLFAGGSFVQWFPLRGITSINWNELSLAGKILDYFWHIALPVTSMVLGGFALITILTKNSVLEEIRKHYVLTARAKGVAERDVLWRHVFRNR